MFNDWASYCSRQSQISARVASESASRVPVLGSAATWFGNLPASIRARVRERVCACVRACDDLRAQWQLPLPPALDSRLRGPPVLRQPSVAAAKAALGGAGSSHAMGGSSRHLQKSASLLQREVANNARKAGFALACLLAPGVSAVCRVSAQHLVSPVRCAPRAGTGIRCAFQQSYARPSRLENPHDTPLPRSANADHVPRDSECCGRDEVNHCLPPLRWRPE